MDNIHDLVEKQRAYYLTGATRSIEFRKDALKKLRSAVKAYESAIEDALLKDLNKLPLETHMTETGLVLTEITAHLKGLSAWMRDRIVSTPVYLQPARSFISPEPFGVSLIIAPWNFPVNCSLMPLIGAISAGNCAVLKPSAYAPATSHVLKELISSVFPEEYIAVVEGGREENSALLEEKFDYIFFTGSVAVGKTVMAAAAKNLTPVTLELGGKSPVIVDKTADIRHAARRIAFGKCLNAGQICVDPDYLLIDETVLERFLDEYKTALEEYFPNKDYSQLPHIVNEKHFRRVTVLLKDQEACIGGRTDEASLFVEPTVLLNVSPDAPVMQEEIFAPILPVFTYTDIDWCIRFINARPKPLAFYLFTKDGEVQNRLLNSVSFGGGCINDVITHTSSHMPFGGVGNSGMGKYHGKASFDTFTHERSILVPSDRIEMPFMNHPYTKAKEKLLKTVLK